jgi:hypothetical protein
MESLRPMSRKTTRISECALRAVSSRDAMRNLRMRISTRIRIVAILAFLGLLPSGSSAFTGEYTVDFGAETDARKDAGSLMCRLDQACNGELESLGLMVSIYLYRSNNDRAVASVYLRGHDLSCCYFEYAAEKVTIDLREPTSRVSFTRVPEPGEAFTLKMSAWALST